MRGLKMARCANNSFFGNWRSVLGAGIILIGWSFKSDAIAANGVGGLDLTGDLAVTFKAIERHSTINHNIRGDDPFNRIRVRIFATRSWSERASMVVELLWDDEADPRVNGAYFIFNRLLGPVNAKVGLIGSPFGNFAYRSSYWGQNSLIGVPAVWHYKTPLLGRGNQRNNDLMKERKRINRGLPILYDACWDYGISFFGAAGALEWEAAVTEAALSNPYAKLNDGYQGIVKLGATPSPGLRFGVSGVLAPWLRPDTIDFARRLESYYQSAVGEYFEFSTGHWQFYHELVAMRWEAPLIREGRLEAASGYWEVKWNFAPGWFAGIRGDIFTYGRIAVNNDGTGGEAAWGYDFDRLEASLGWRVIREGMIRLGFQLTRFRAAGIDPERIAALQFFFAF